MLLFLDTSSAEVSIALMEGARVVALCRKAMERGHGEALIPLIQQLMEEAGVAMKDLTGVAVAVGPGSFTGVRIGIATARGFGLALDIPVQGVTNFEAAACGLAQPVRVVLDTKRGDYYTQAFDAGKPVDEPSIQTAEELKTQLPFMAVGDGASTLSQEIGCAVAERAYPAAVAVGLVAQQRAAPLSPEPLYLREAHVTL